MKAKLRLGFEVDITVNESELQALDALVGYGTDEFLKCFYEHLGNAYLQPHEAGLRSIFEKINDIRPAVAAIKEVRQSATETFAKYV